MALITAPNEIVKHMPSACEGCQHYQICKGAACTAEKRHILAVALNTVGAVSIKRTHEILSRVFNIPIATGTISSMVKRCAGSLNETVGKIKDKMISSALGHFDETVEKGKDSLSYYHYHKFDKKYNGLIKQARKGNPLPETTEKNPCSGRTPCELQGIRLPIYP